MVVVAEVIAVVRTAVRVDSSSSTLGVQQVVVSFRTLSFPFERVSRTTVYR